MHKPIQVLEISSFTDKNDEVVLDITPTMPVIPILTKPGDITSTGNLFEERIWINSLLDLQPELNALKEVYQTRS